MQNIPNSHCKIHNLPYLYICLFSNCSLTMALCDQCKLSHLQHKHRLVQYNSFIPAIISALNTQNFKDIQTMKQNNLLQNQVKFVNKVFLDRQKILLDNIMTQFQFQKNFILQTTKQNQQHSKTNIVKYFDKISQKGWLTYRILFSSSKGLHSFYSSYNKYCQINQISINKKPQFLSQIKQQNEIQQQLKKLMKGTLTQNIMNFIKLKISKKDAMKISNAVASATSSILKPQHAIPFPPPSPTKKNNKTGKTQITINANFS